MIDVDLKALLACLNRPCRKALEGAAGMAVSRGHYEVTCEHMLMVLADSASMDVPLILTHYGIDHDRFRKALQRTVEDMRGGNTGRPVFSPLLLQWLQNGWILGSIELGQRELRSGALFAAMVADRARRQSDDVQDLLGTVDAAALKRDFADIVAASSESATLPGGARASGEAKAPPQPGERPADAALSRFCVDLTAAARAGKIDPVFGREAEIRQIVNILGRRRKNNPICVGEAGVGKSAVVEGLARKMVAGEVPDFLKDTDLLTLDLQMLQAGASVKGEFEQRLKDVMAEVAASPRPVILFIDEVHTLVGAGGAQGTGDAANLIKPALARGEMRTIAATTFSEYKRYIDKDPALARRFQIVSLDEPSPELAVMILRGLREVYERAHGVYVRDDGIAAAAHLSARYLSGRQLPDKAIDVLDTAAARVKLSVGTRPAQVDDLERDIAVAERERSAIQRDIAATSAGDPARVAQLGETIERQRQRLAEILAQWEAERDAVRRVLDLRRELAQAAAGEAPGEDSAADGEPAAAAEAGPVDEPAAPAPSGGDGATATATATATAADLDAAMAALKGLTARSGMIHYEVSPEVVAQVISDWTGIPAGNMLRPDKEAITGFAGHLRSRIKGQDHAVSALDNGMRTAKAGLQNPDAPLGVFLFVGPSGVGKTETALGIADLLFGGERFMTTINMSEFQEKHTVSRLIGSPPGYVGYGEGGRLTEAVRQRPYSVVLLDEVEKADLEVMNLFYQVFDKGMLSDGEGRLIDFRNTVVVLTSNLATDTITRMGMSDPMPSVAQIAEAIRPELSAHFKPALLARMQIVPFLPLRPDVMRTIVELKLGRVVRRLADRHKIELVYEDGVVERIAQRCTEVETGARNADHIINGTLLPELSTELLAALDGESAPTSLKVSVAEDGRFAYAIR